MTSPSPFGYREPLAFGGLTILGRKLEFGTAKGKEKVREIEEEEEEEGEGEEAEGEEAEEEEGEGEGEENGDGGVSVSAVPTFGATTRKGIPSSLASLRDVSMESIPGLGAASSRVSERQSGRESGREEGKEEEEGRVRIG